MKSSLKVVLLTALLALFAGICSAQGDGSGQGGGDSDKSSGHHDGSKSDPPAGSPTYTGTNTNSNTNTATSSSNSSSSSSSTSSSSSSSGAVSTATGGNATATGGEGGKGGNASSSSNSGGNTQSVSFISQAPHRPAPAAIAPFSAATAPCRVSGSAGLSGPIGGLSLGGSKLDGECDKREAARAFAAIGETDAALQILCTTKAAVKAKLSVCAGPKAAEVVAPAEVVSPKAAGTSAQ